jgi:tRNA nucleotidyltransferase (CCA-adding enzyme)
MAGAVPDRSRLARSCLPAPVLDLSAALKEAGGQAYLVGGAVRDSLLGRPVNDWDLATDLLPETVAALFPRTVQIGIRFGTVLVMRDGTPYEVTTFRLDGVYSDARRPDSIAFTGTLEEDLIRRDFTINALAYDPVENRLVDPTGGEADLALGLLRAVGRAEERFQEDGLRLLRAVRLAAQLGFELEADTYRALVLCAPNLERIAQERVRAEFDKLIEAPQAASALSVMLETGLLRRALPELAACYGVAQNPHHAFDVFHHTLAALDAAPPERRLVRLAALFHDLGKPETREERAETAAFYGHQFVGERLATSAMRRLRYPNEEVARVRHLVHHHMFHYRPEWTDSAIRRFLREVGTEHLEDLFALRAADTMGNGLRKRIAPELTEFRRRIELEIERQNALTVRDLCIDGYDLMEALGLVPGPIIGRALSALLEDVLDDPSRNEREWLLARARELRRAEANDGA